MLANAKEVRGLLELDQIYDLLVSIGAEPQYNGDHLIATTLCHHQDGDGSHKLYYYDNSKMFMCYTNCGTFDIFELLQKIKNWDFQQSLRYIINYLKLEETYNEETNPWQYMFKYVNDVEEVDIQHNIYNDTLIQNMPKILPEAWIEEGISQLALEHFNITYYEPDNRIIIPHYNANGQLLGIRFRDLSPIQYLAGKYRPLKINGVRYSHPLSINLYGFHRNQSCIASTKKAIIYESEKSVLKAETISLYNYSVATCGFNISDYQIKMLLSSGVDEIIFAFDKDYYIYKANDFYVWFAKIQKLAKKIHHACKVTVMMDKQKLLDYKDSPIDKGKKVLEELFRTRVEIKEI